jgi:hypothetical protein
MWDKLGKINIIEEQGGELWKAIIVHYQQDATQWAHVASNEYSHGVGIVCGDMCIEERCIVTSRNLFLWRWSGKCFT